MSATDKPLTIGQYLRQHGVRDPQMPDLLRHIGDRYRSAHLGRHSIDPGDLVLDRDLADTVLEDYTVLICPNCDTTWGVEESDNGSCLNCGYGVVRPSDRPVGILIPTTPLPIALGGTRIKRCVECGRTWSPSTYYVETRIPGIGVGAVCRHCAHKTQETAGWAGVCDIADALDAVMQDATDAKQRRLFAGQIAHMAEHFAGWRWPDDEQAEDVNPSTTPS